MPPTVSTATAESVSPRTIVRLFGDNVIGRMSANLAMIVGYRSRAHAVVHEPYRRCERCEGASREHLHQITRPSRTPSPGRILQRIRWRTPTKLDANWVTPRETGSSTTFAHVVIRRAPLVSVHPLVSVF